MRNPEFSNSESLNDNPDSNSEFLRSVNQRRGDEVNRAKMLVEQEARQKELLKKQAELEAKLRAMGVDPAPIIEKARADYLAKKASLAQETAKAVETTTQKSSEPVKESVKATEPIPDEYADRLIAEYDKESEPESPVESKEESPEEKPKEQESLEESQEEVPEEKAPEEVSEEVNEDSIEDSEVGEVSPVELGKKVKKGLGPRKLLTGFIVGLAGLAATSAIGGFLFGRGNNKSTASGNQATIESTASADTETPGITISENGTVSVNSVSGNSVSGNNLEQSNYAGETINGLSYDYSEYADRDKKVSHNAYGYDYSDQHGNREKTTEGILHMAGIEPEALASYAYNIFTDDEKKDLGIDGLTMVQIDNKFDEAGGGALQKKLLDKFKQILEDQENTRFDFYHENSTEQTNYTYFVDDNEDGKLTPDELHIGYDVKKRNGAPQVDIYRTIKNADGTPKEKKMLDLNMRCGYQPNYKIAPKGVKRVQANVPVVTNVAPAQPIITGGGPVATVITGGGPVENGSSNHHDDKVTPPPVIPPDLPPVIPPDNPNHVPKNEAEERKNAGDFVTPLPLDENITPPTTIEEDRKNFANDEAQRQADEAARAEAERVAREQAEREAAARQEAENREESQGSEEQERHADEAQERAESGASEEQESRAEEESRHAEEQSEREERQESADRESESRDRESESHSDDSASERSSSFESGDF